MKQSAEKDLEKTHGSHHLIKHVGRQERSATWMRSTDIFVSQPKI
jgi:hypothetical protein